jgi:hypothetical protein
MKSSSISFYFVLYVVAITTVFVITMERDQLLRQRDEDMAHLIEVYVKPLRLSSYVDTARFFIDPTLSATREPVKMRINVDGPVEKSDVAFRLLGAEQLLDDGDSREKPISGTMINDGGDGVLTYPSLEEGVYAFRVAGYKRRIIMAGDKMEVAIRDTSYLIPYSERLEKVDRDTTVLLAKVVKSGVVPPQLTLSVADVQDNWVLGPPYKKKVFVSGVEDLQKVTFSASAPGGIERNLSGESFVMLVWERPTTGKKEFMASADANRGLGEKDRSSINFSVDVLPPVFVSVPSEKGFWGIPYIFDGQIAGLSPLDITVEVRHDGQLIGARPVVPKDTVIPDRSWSSLNFKLLYKGVSIKEHRVALTAPPPPQIKWVQQNFDRDRNVFLITAACSDPVGGAVKMSLQSQPSGIAQLDKIRGTTFTITINLEGKPSAVFLKLTASDQYGGQSTSAKQFNMP